MGKIKPWEHQLKAKQDIIHNENGLLNRDRVCFFSACGTGKTNTALWTVEEYLFDVLKKETSFTLQFYPSLKLVEQSFLSNRELTRIKNYNPLFICSDPKIASKDDVDNDITLEELKEMIGNYLVTTDIERIKDYLQNDIKNKVVYCTYQSAHLLATAIAQLNLKADIAIYDEAHNVALKNNNKKDTRTIILHDKENPTLKGEYLSVDKRLFMTATPTVYTIYKNKEEQNKESNLAYSMDNENYFGGVAHELGMRDAIDKKLIAPYKIIGVEIDKAFEEKYGAELEQLKTSNPKLYVHKLEAIKNIAIIKAMINENLKKTIVFHRNIEHSKRFVENIKNAYDDCTVKHIDGSMSHQEKVDIYKELRNLENMIMSNSKLLSEGVDIPTVDMVAFMNASNSVKDIIQRIGRTQRFEYINGVKDTNKIGFVFVPFFKDETMAIINNKITVEDTKSKFLNTLKSLESSDKLLKDSITYKITTMTQNDALEIAENIKTLKLEQEKLEDEEKIDLNKKEIKRLEHRLNLYDLYTSNQIVGYISATTLDKNIYVRNSKNSDDIDDDEQIANTFISEYEKSNDSINYFEANLGDSWDETCDKVAEYYFKFKNLPLDSDKDKNIVKLRIWIGTQRTKYNKGILSIDKVNKLKNIYTNILDNPDDISKKNHINATIDFINKFGYQELKSTTKYKNFNIGTFKSNQRMKYEKLTTQKEKLEMIKEFSCIHEDYLISRSEISKRNHINATIDFINKFGYQELKSTTKYKNFNIGAFESTQRMNYEKLKTEKEKLEMIKEFSCIHEDYLISRSEISKRNHINATIDFINKFGYQELKSTTKYKNFNIGTFKSNQRMNYEKLTTQKEKLEMIKEFSCIHEDYLINPDDISKRNHINATLEFIKKFGYKKFTNRTKYKDFNIGTFKSNQRKKFNKLKTEKEKLAMIEEFSKLSLEYLGKNAVLFIELEKNKTIKSQL